ncbi:hypothetical protein SLEP1_g47356 [Rubroshorea leprosula]|uniref:Uncharacterized protein n=1 Tax=Rubroshorea leprosula TaxID=152421 RepID=A0AAV5LRX7_9ROSI|nr:hypothetical protein SLEP1_g47356 [Rubroshorea leprosula]
MIQRVGIEGVIAVNSSSLGAMGTPFERARELKRKREEELDGAQQQFSEDNFLESATR